MLDLYSATENQKSKTTILRPVFYPAAGMIVLLAALSIVSGEAAGAFFEGLQDWIISSAGWFYALTVTGLLVFCLLLASTRYGHIKLGPDHAEPDYSFPSWFAMLFSAGMGIGLLFFSVAEPITHFNAPFLAEPGSVEAAREAMQATYFHWGLHAWAIYAVVGMVLAYFCFRHGLPLSIRSALYPLLGDRIHGPVGHVVDVVAVIGTLFGVATSLGFGVSQINAGLGYLFSVPVSTGVQIALIAGITAMATISVVLGLDAGIRRLSIFNMWIALALLVFVISLGPTQLLLNTFVENFGLYGQALVRRSFMLGAYEADQTWIGSWPLFYWGWWISWSPFVGMFIARISRGRTVRQFVTGVLFVPCILTFVWMTAFGNGALSVELSGVSHEIADAVRSNMPLALFKYLEHFPLSGLVSGVAIVLVVTFFVTSSDSGSLVIDTITSGGHLDPPRWQRIFWATTEGAVAAVLMLVGGLAALQTATMTAALPFALIIILACYGLMRGLRLEAARKRGAAVAPEIPHAGDGQSWKRRLAALLSYPKREEVENYLAQTARPALEKVAKAIRASDSDAQVEIAGDGAEICISHGNELDFRYAIVIRGLLKPDFAFAGKIPDQETRERFYRAEVHLLEGGQNYDVYGFTEEQLIHDVLNQYDKHMHFLNLVRPSQSED